MRAGWISARPEEEVVAVFYGSDENRECRSGREARRIGH